MLFPTATLGLLLGYLSHLASALPAPVHPAVAASAELSKHNIYLVTCNPRDSSVGTTGATFTAVAYFRSPFNKTEYIDEKDPKAKRAALVSDPASPWEGVKWKVKVWREKAFTSDIMSGSETLSARSLAGSVTLAQEGYTEDFVCFKDGVTGIRIREDEGIRGNCVADYWCPSVSEKRKKDDDGDAEDNKRRV
ncbi:hypothetical protein K491DRAFT_723340 [Lophiostoma macrostomum CBS 122681]|uniref:Uncharacterized protein n=1 Tax=Lophiostoma macrostomum CBS 122681 TaxID=1314788 RepID=A0A6A6SKP2_9PLEO|nr:hypothetical protein K491DRAFT_723340 [Lophiostoma macrostomum CBS 122681]